MLTRNSTNGSLQRGQGPAVGSYTANTLYGDARHFGQLVEQREMRITIMCAISEPWKVSVIYH